jgi:hypothetical protein
MAGEAGGPRAQHTPEARLRFWRLLGDQKLPRTNRHWAQIPIQFWRFSANSSWTAVHLSPDVFLEASGCPPVVSDKPTLGPDTSSVLVVLNERRGVESELELKPQS